MSMEVEEDEIYKRRQAVEREVEMRLKPDLDRVCARRDGTFEEIMDLLALEDNIRILKQQDQRDIELKVDIGEMFFMQAEVPDASKIGVNIGLGIYVEMSLDEGLIYIQERKSVLETRTEALNKRLAEIEAYFKILCKGLELIPRNLLP